MSRKIGLDIGTSTLVSGVVEGDEVPVFTSQRDCFYKIIPKTAVNKNSIKISLDKRKVSYVEDEEGAFIIIGKDALEIAVERNDTAERPMVKGVISPKDKAALPMLKFIIKSLIGEGKKGDKCFFSVPSAPIDGNFDILYHREMLSLYISQMGFEATPINEAFAVALSELVESGLTGAVVTYGAGLCNFSIVHEGDPLIQFSVGRSGDYIDTSVANALDVSPSLVQVEKEAGTDLYNPKTKIIQAVSMYYRATIGYTLQTISYELNKKKKDLPMFRDPMTIVVAGGLTKAKGFVKMFDEILKTVDFPMEVEKVVCAKDPLLAVANGALLASMI